MTHREKVDAALADLAERGVARSRAAPWVYRWLWAAGFAVRPPHYQTFAGLFLTHAPVFWAAIIVGGGVFTVFIVGPPAVPVTVGLGVLVGGLNGLGMAVSYRFQAARLGLPRWADFDPYRVDDDAAW